MVAINKNQKDINKGYKNNFNMKNKGVQIMKICNKCGVLFKDEAFESNCPILNCSGSIITVDNSMIDVVRRMEKLGLIPIHANNSIVYKENDKRTVITSVSFHGSPFIYYGETKPEGFILNKREDDVFTFHKVKSDLSAVEAVRTLSEDVLLLLDWIQGLEGEGLASFETLASNSDESFDDFADFQEGSKLDEEDLDEEEFNNEEIDDNIDSFFKDFARENLKDTKGIEQEIESDSFDENTKFYNQEDDEFIGFDDLVGVDDEDVDKSEKPLKGHYADLDSLDLELQKEIIERLFGGEWTLKGSSDEKEIERVSEESKSDDVSEECETSKKNSFNSFEDLGNWGDLIIKSEELGKEKVKGFIDALNSMPNPLVIEKPEDVIDSLTTMINLWKDMAKENKEEVDEEKEEKEEKKEKEG